MYKTQEKDENENGNDKKEGKREVKIEEGAVQDGKRQF
jgi:hypothetical protein